MSTTTATPTLEDSIKTALDAADMAITVSGEFDKIRNDYDLARAEVKTVNKQIRTVFFSALAASTLAIVVSGLMYFRTLSEMQTANETSLEGLVIFAENIDKLTAAMTSLEKHEAIIGSFSEDLVTLRDTTDNLASAASTEQAATRKTVQDGNTELKGLLSQTTRGILDELKATLLDSQGKLDQKIGDMSQKMAQAPESPDGTAAAPSVTLAEINANLQTIMLLQKEISAKISVAKPAAPKVAPSAKGTAPKAQDDNPIKYP